MLIRILHAFLNRSISILINWSYHEPHGSPCLMYYRKWRNYPFQKNKNKKTIFARRFWIGFHFCSLKKLTNKVLTIRNFTPPLKRGIYRVCIRAKLKRKKLDCLYEFVRCYMSCVTTTLWMHHVGTNKTEKAK